MMDGFAAVAELRSAALIDLDDVLPLYHYTASAERRSRPDPKKLLKLWITVRQTNRFWERGNRTPGRLTRPDRPLEEP